MKHLEDDIQREVLQWLRVAHRKVYDCTIHVPNGGRRNLREAARLKTLGVRAGVPDLLCFWPAPSYRGAALELKAPKGRTRPGQLDWLARLADLGWRVGVTRSFDEARAFFEEYLTGGSNDQGAQNGQSPGA